MRGMNGPRAFLAAMLLGSLAVGADCRANDSAGSEISHVFAGMAMRQAIRWSNDTTAEKRRRWPTWA